MRAREHRATRLHLDATGTTLREAPVPRLSGIPGQTVAVHRDQSSSLPSIPMHTMLDFAE